MISEEKPSKSVTMDSLMAVSGLITERRDRKTVSKCWDVIVMRYMHVCVCLWLVTELGVCMPNACLYWGQANIDLFWNIVGAILASNKVRKLIGRRVVLTHFLWCFYLHLCWDIVEPVLASNNVTMLTGRRGVLTHFLYVFTYIYAEILLNQYWLATMWQC